MEKFLEAMRLYFCFAVIIIMVTDITGQGIEGGTMNIACGISGTYTYPGWIKDGSVIIAIEGSPSLNGLYASRFSFAADQKTLFVNPVNSSDAGSYVCSVTGLPPATTLITVVLPTTEPEDDDCSNPCPIVIAVYICFALAIVVVIALIIYCCYILIWAYMEYKKMKVIQEDNNATVLVILIFAAVLFFLVSIWFIVMQLTVEDCEEMTKKECNINIGLMVVEIVVFVLGVIAIILAYIRHKKMKMKVMKIIRLKILHIIKSAFPNHMPLEDLKRTIPGVEDIGQHLTDLVKDHLIRSTQYGFVFNPSETERMKMEIMKIIRLKILHIIKSAFPNPMSVKDLERILVDVERAIIVQQLEELQKEGNIKSKEHGYVRRVYTSSKSVQLTGETCRENILQSLTHAYPDIMTVEDFCDLSYRIVLDSTDDTIKQELEKLKKDGLIISQHGGFVVKDHPPQTELIRERILQFLGYAFPKALTTDVLRKILPGVEDIGQHLNKLKEDHLISSTKGGFVINPSETAHPRHPQ